MRLSKRADLSVSETQLGFTIIELVVTVAILSILTGLSLASFTVYRENAEYSKGTATMRNARTALNVGVLELPEDYTLDYTESGLSGGLLSGELSRLLPGANTPDQVRLSAEVSACDESSGPFDRSQFLVVEPCRSKQEVRWQKFCGGAEVLLEHVTNASPCS